VDKLIYVAMTGASQTLNRQATTAHNLANATTTGYRAESNVFRAVQVFGDGLPTRAFVVDSSPRANFNPGTIQHTGRDLDVAVEGAGWIVVQTKDGSEALTRNGSLKVNDVGLLQTRDGLNVMGDGGAITIPPDSQIAIARDGTVSTIPNGPAATNVNAIGRIKLVNPPEDQLIRGDDGLFRLKDGQAAQIDPKVSLIGGALEGSNVNVAEELVNMIGIARQFDMQMRIIQTAESSSRDASQILSLTR
jgi:flagellar basal-body rod protein FlgF